MFLCVILCARCCGYPRTVLSLEQGLIILFSFKSFFSVSVFAYAIFGFNFFSFSCRKVNSSTDSVVWHFDINASTSNDCMSHHHITQRPSHRQCYTILFAFLATVMHFYCPDSIVFVGVFFCCRNNSWNPA